jgi:hypothetical protein
VARRAVRTDLTSGAFPSASSRLRTIHTVAAFIVMTLTTLLLTNHVVRYRHWAVVPALNSSAMEGLSWINGRLDLPARATDMAVYDDKNYKVLLPRV